MNSYCLVKTSIGLRRLLKERKYPGGQELPLYLLREASSREKGIGWRLRRLRRSLQNDRSRGAQRMQRRGIRAPVPPQILLPHRRGPTGSGAVQSSWLLLLRTEQIGLPEREGSWHLSVGPMGFVARGQHFSFVVLRFQKHEFVCLLWEAVLRELTHTHQTHVTLMYK